MAFTLTTKQSEALSILADPNADHVAGTGGSRSGKTCLFLYAMIVRALKCPGSRHCAVRQTFRDAKQKLGMQTLPELHKLIGVSPEIDKSNWVFHYPGHSELWLCGLDDVDNRDARILGSEYSTILYDEASDIPWSSIQIANTRLAQRNDLRKRDWYSFNPPSTASYLYKIFVNGVDPVDLRPLHNRDHYRLFRINPKDNLDHIDPAYLERLQGLSARQRLRFLEGEWGDASEGALWRREWIDGHRMPKVNEELVEVVVGVDPACGGECRTGIVVVGKGHSGHLYILADRTSAGTPAEWSMAVADARKDFAARIVVAESNAGGSMVEAILKQADPQAEVRLVHAGVSKQLRAEPIASLAERGLLHHVGEFPELEDEMLSWKPGSDSPDRMDAAVHAAAHFIAETHSMVTPRVAGAGRPAELDEDLWTNL